MSDAYQRRYSAVAIGLHWTIAALIVANIVIGLRFDGLHGMAKFTALQWHKSFGITVLILSLGRLGWRLANRPPPYPAHMAPWERAAARTVHLGFYALMLALPLTGWMIVSASTTNIPTLLYGAIAWPHISPIHALPMAMRKGLTDRFEIVHDTLAWTMILLLAMHLGAVAKHLIIDRDEVLWRMAPLGLVKPKAERNS